MGIKIPFCLDHASKSQAGNVVLALFAALGLLGAVGVGYTTLIKGPAQGVQTITSRTSSETDIFSAIKIIVASSQENQASADCDTDTLIEPLPWRDPGAGETAPVGGGIVPDITQAPSKDAWGTTFGYCVWDHGSMTTTNNVAACGGSSAKRRKGGDVRSEYALAVISAGKDRIFQTSCADYVNATTPVITRASGSDDIFVALTYAEAFDAGGGSDIGDVEDSACMVDNIGLLRYEMEIMQICLSDGAGGAMWQEVGAEADTAPGFNPTNNATTNTVYTSNNATFTGFFGTRLATVDNGATIVVNGTPMGQSAQISTTDSVAIRATSATLPEVTRVFTLKISSIARTWTLTTRLKTPPVLSVSPTTVNNMWADGTSGTAYSGTTVLTITNTAAATEDSAVMGAHIFSNSTNFESTASTCTGMTLAPSQTCTITVRSKATATAGSPFTSSLTVQATGISNPGTVSTVATLNGDSLFPISLSSSNNVTLSTLTAFTTNGRWAANRPKRVIIPSGVIIGSTSPATPAMQSGTGWGNTLYVTIDAGGSIRGAGGQPNGGAGGTAFLASAVGIQLVNNGTIWAGGGAGGNGGNGGGGVWNSSNTVTEGPVYDGDPDRPRYAWYNIDPGAVPEAPSGYTAAAWANTWLPTAPYNTTSINYNGWTYYRHNRVYAGGPYALYRQTTVNTPNYTSGGAGGAGGRGQGHDGANTGGAGGGAPGTNAGWGGTGGSGGTWGNNGTAGAAGGAGNNGAGAAGTAGGLAGWAIQNVGNVTLTGSGTRLGR